MFKEKTHAWHWKNMISGENRPQNFGLTFKEPQQLVSYMIKEKIHVIEKSWSQVKTFLTTNFGLRSLNPALATDYTQ
jgi:hypothetical protein